MNVEDIALFQTMTLQQARKVLDMAKVDKRIPYPLICQALKMTGDIHGLFGDQRTDCQSIGNNVSSKPWVSGVCSGQSKEDEEGPYGAVGRYARTRSF